MDHFGYLTIQVLNAGGALPIRDALVKIESADEYDRVEAMTDVTDVDGRTETFALPTPDSSFSLTPTPLNAPQALYKVTVFKEGYYIRVLESVALFENIYTTLTVPLVPTSLYNQSENAPQFPKYESEDFV